MENYFKFSNDTFVWYILACVKEAAENYIMFSENMI